MKIKVGCDFRKTKKKKKHMIRKKNILYFVYSFKLWFETNDKPDKSEIWKSWNYKM